MALSDVKIRTAKASDKPRRLWDGGGLYLEVSPSGAKLWRLKYRYHLPAAFFRSLGDSRGSR